MKKIIHSVILSALFLIFACNNRSTETKVKVATVKKTNQTTKDYIKEESDWEINHEDFAFIPSSPNTKSNTPQPDEKLTVADIYKCFKKSGQTFSFNSGRDTTIVCSEGTQITIKSNSFISEKTGKEVEGNIQLTVKEFYKISDLVLANLSTMSDGKLIETGGTLYISASSKNENCILQKGETIEIGFPRNEEKEDMQLFTGTRDSDNKINWKLDDNSNYLNYSIVDEMPCTQGGDEKRIEYLRKVIKYPQSAKENGIQGTVYVSFIIDKNGNITNAKVLRGISKDCDMEALAAVKGMPKFKAGKRNGLPVNVSFCMPIKFSLIGENNYSSPSYIYNTSNTNISDTNANRNSEINSLNSYLLSSTKLGWINCDRFLKENKVAKVNYKVNLQNSDQANVNIIFHRIKSIMTGYPYLTNFRFDNIPLGEKITVIAVKQIDDKPYIAIKETVTSSLVDTTFAFEPLTMEKLKNEMEKLNNLN